MSGNAGIRGYIIQTIICVIDTLDSDSKWTSVTLEPTDESEKVDIRWKYPNDVIKLVQVKSSENTIGHSAAKKWCNELKSNSPDATEYELSLVGPLAGNMINVSSINEVEIKSLGSLNTDVMINLASNKIDAYYTKHNKPKISFQVRELIVQTLSLRFATSSIVGKEITRTEFDKILLDWIQVIENQIETNPFAVLSPPKEDKATPIDHRLVDQILKLIGWKHFEENYSFKVFNEHTQEDDIYSVNFMGETESKLKDKTGDFILASSIHDISYPEQSKEQVLEYIDNTNRIVKKKQKEQEIPLKRFEATNISSLLFWLTTDNEDLLKDFIHQSKDNFKRNRLIEEVTYYLIDNRRATFLISSIVTAKNYREDISVKFLYPITESNQSPDKIGHRGLKLPVQYINSSVIPIIKEDKSKISFLLFCSDPFSEDSLKKLIWLTIRLSSGFGNEYLLYFPDYEDNKHGAIASKVIRSFDEEILDDKIQIRKYVNVSTEALGTINGLETSPLKNETYNIEESDTLRTSKHLNEAFINILPYADLLKPFLRTEAVKADDLRIFLAKKGIFIKKSDKGSLIDIMSNLLLSPQELEGFKDLINIKDRTIRSSDELYRTKKDESLKVVFEQISPNFEDLTEGLNTKIVNSELKFVPSTESPDEYILTLITELKDPTSSLLVNTNWGKAEIVIKKDEDRVIIATKNTITREDKLIVNRALKILNDELKTADFIEDEVITVKFSNFKNNLERVNFLLSFTNVDSSSIFKSPDIVSSGWSEIDNFHKTQKIITR